MGKINKIAVLTSGGDAPGMNAAIRAIVRTASYFNVEVCGIKRGYAGLIKGEVISLNKRKVGNILHRGGTFLKTSRSDEFKTSAGRKKAYDQLKKKGIQGLIVIGGNGSMTGADIFSREFSISIVGIPATIDNDLAGSDYSIGFDTAVNTAIDAVDRIRDTADSHDRVFLIEVMGRDAGFIALQTGIATGAAGIVIPEKDMTPNELIDMIKTNLKRKKLFNLILIAEGNNNGSAHDIELSIKIALPNLDMRVTVIGHLQRGGSPSAVDRLNASRMGYAAVKGMLDGRSNKMVGIKNDKITYTPFKDAIKPRRISNELIKMAEILAT